MIVGGNNKIEQSDFFDYRIGDNHISDNFHQIKIFPKENTKSKPDIEISPQQLQQLANIDDFSSIFASTDLEFAFEESEKMSIVKIINKKTEEIIAQIPSKDFFDRMAFFKEHILPGFLFDKNS